MIISKLSLYIELSEIRTLDIAAPL